MLSRLRCVDYTVVPSICKNKVLSILTYLKNYWVNRPECQRVVLSRLRCVDYIANYSISKNKSLKHFVISQNYLANRPECQRVVLNRWRCAEYAVVSSIWKNKVLNILSYLKTIGSIDRSVNALCSAGCAPSTTLTIIQFARIRF